MYLLLRELDEAGPALSDDPRTLLEWLRSLEVELNSSDASTREHWRTRLTEVGLSGALVDWVVDQRKNPSSEIEDRRTVIDFGKRWFGHNFTDDYDRRYVTPGTAGATEQVLRFRDDVSLAASSA